MKIIPYIKESWPIAAPIIKTAAYAGSATTLAVMLIAPKLFDDFADIPSLYDQWKGSLHIGAAAAVGAGTFKILNLSYNTPISGLAGLCTMVAIGSSIEKLIHAFDLFRTRDDHPPFVVQMLNLVEPCLVYPATAGVLATGIMAASSLISWKLGRQ